MNGSEARIWEGRQDTLRQMRIPIIFGHQSSDIVLACTKFLQLYVGCTCELWQFHCILLATPQDS